MIYYKYNGDELLRFIYNSKINITTINPFKYHSYYHDKESNLYYIKSRYYNS